MRKGLVKVSAWTAGAIALLVSVGAWAQETMEGIRGRDAIEGIFGVDAETLASAIRTAAESNSILAPVAGIVNLAALLAAVCVVLLTFVNALLQTGEHGKVGGRFSMVWVPIRTAMALMFLTPLSIGGYSVIQAIVLWLGLQGSGFADQAWDQSNRYLSENLGFSRPGKPRAVGDIAASLYAMEMCAQAINSSAERGMGDGTIATPEFVEIVGGRRWYRYGPDDHVRTLAYNGVGSLEGPAPVCGSITVRREYSEDSVLERGSILMLRMQVEGMARLRQELARVARQQIDGEIGSDEARRLIKAADEAFAASELRRSQAFLSVANTAEGHLRQRQIATARQAGWLAAGAYYMTFASFSSTIDAIVNMDPEIVPPRLNALSPATVRDVRPWIELAGRTAPSGAARLDATDFNADNLEANSGDGADYSEPNSSGSGVIAWAVGKIKESISQLMRGAFDKMVEIVVGDGRSIVVSLSEVGHWLLTAASAASVVAIVFALKAGAVTAGLGALVVGLLSGPVILGLFTIGAFLAYFLPAMPFLIWVSGVAGWLLLLVQATVAAPLWAAAHVSPEGEGFAGQRASQGYMLLISLIARPVLMIAGLMAGMLVIQFLGMFVVKAFVLWIDSAAGSTFAGLTSLIIWMLIFTGLILMLARWSFSLIHIVPDAVLRFIGSSAESLGESQMAEQARTMAVAAYGALASMKTSTPKAPSPEAGSVAGKSS